MSLILGARLPARGAARAKLIYGSDVLEGLDERWDALVRRQAVPNPTLSSTWLRALVETEPGVPVIVIVEERGRLLAGGAFAIRRPAGRAGPAIATWLGDDRQWFSPELLVDPEAPQAGSLAVDALLADVAAIHLSGTADGPTAAALAARAPWRCHSFGADGYLLPLPPPRLKYAVAKVEYSARRAARLGATVTTRVARTQNEVGEALERLFILHQSRWSGRADCSSVFSSTERWREWHRRVIGNMAARDEVRIVELFEDDQLMGSTLGLLAGRGALFHTVAIRRGGRLSGPGHAVLLALVEAATQAGVQVADLGWGGGERDGAKTRVGALHVDVGRFLAARSPAWQRALEVALETRSRLSRVADACRSRSAPALASSRENGSAARDETG